MPFYRRCWDEARGDDHDECGPATYFFWVLDGVVEQQVEVYENGVVLAYDRYHREDRYGQLSGEALDETEWAPFEIDIDTYQGGTDRQPYNRR